MCVKLGLGIDAGGTYTDTVVYDLIGRKVLAKAKSPTTHGRLLEGIVGALDQLPPELLPQVRLACLSTTLATNATVEGRGAPVGLLLMPYIGFEPDELSIRPVAIVPGRLRIDGRPVDPIDPDRTRAALDTFLQTDPVASVAVSGYAGVVNPEHELAVMEIVREHAGLPVVCGHQLSAKLNFLNRARTAVLNARLLPLIEQLLDAVDEALQCRRIRATLMVVKGDGTLAGHQLARQRPIDTVLSGPAASVIGARELTGQDDAVVVDVGGTTTDIAVLRDGHVALSPEGANVGGWQTSTEAVDMHTRGLGGDSYIQVGRRMELAIGPQRVLPLAVLFDRHPELRPALEDAVADGPRGPAQAQLDFFMLTGRPDGLDPTPREAEILQLLGEGPASRLEIARAFDYMDPTLIRVGRLEQRRIVQRCGLTPTDVFHVTGRFRRWNVDGPRRALTVLADWMNTDLDALLERIGAELHRLMAERVVDRVLPPVPGRNGRPADPLGRLLLDTIVGRQSIAGLDVTARLDRPLIGIGAPAVEFVPPAAEQLGVQAIIPSDADVAGAIGAVTSQVVVRQQARISPNAEGFFDMTTDTGLRTFGKQEVAERFAHDYLTDRIRRRAAQAGTRERHVALEQQVRRAPLADGSDQLVEVVVDGLLVGTPSDGRSTPPNPLPPPPPPEL